MYIIGAIDQVVTFPARRDQVLRPAKARVGNTLSETTVESVVQFPIAAAAYLFREPMPGFSVSLQLSLNDMLAIGNWIELEKYKAKGLVEDIYVTRAA